MKWSIALLAVIAFLFAAWPAFLFDVPIGQTDSASHYVYAKTYAEQGLSAENPAYNQYGSVERFINEYPPFSVVMLGTLLRFFDPIMLLNGVYGGLFAALAVVYLYLFVKELLNSRVALLTSALFLFNVRAYVSLFIGLYAAYVAYCLTFPALYYALLAFRSKLSKLDDSTTTVAYTFASIFVLFLIALTYPTHAAFVLLLQLSLFIGLYSEQHVKIRLPAVKITLKKFEAKNLVYPLGYAFASLGLLALVLRMVIFTSGHARGSWIMAWIGSLLAGNCSTYPCLWTHFTLLDGPVLTVVALAAFGYAIWKNQWALVGLGFAGLLVVLSDWLFVSGDQVILVYFYRFYITFYVLIALFSAYGLSTLVKKQQALAQLLLGLILVIQLVKLGAFFSLVQPAMLPEDMAAALYLKEHPGSVYYLNNLPEHDTFRSFKWIPVFAERNELAIKDDDSALDPSSLEQFDYLYVGDSTQQNFKYPIAFTQGNTRIYTLRGNA